MSSLADLVNGFCPTQVMVRSLQSHVQGLLLAPIKSKAHDCNARTKPSRSDPKLRLVFVFEPNDRCQVFGVNCAQLPFILVDGRLHQLPLQSKVPAEIGPKTQGDPHHHH